MIKKDVITDLTNASLNGTICSFKDKNMGDAEYKNLAINEGLFDTCDFSGKNTFIHDCTFNKCIFLDCNFSKITLINVKFKDCNISRCNFTETNLMDVEFSSGFFSQNTLTDIKLNNVEGLTETTKNVISDSISDKNEEEISFEDKLYELGFQQDVEQNEFFISSEFSSIIIAFDTEINEWRIMFNIVDPVTQEIITVLSDTINEEIPINELKTFILNICDAGVTKANTELQLMDYSDDVNQLKNNI